MARKHTSVLWSDEELALLYEMAKTKTAAEISKCIPNHTICAINTKIRRGGIKTKLKWTDEELLILKNNYELPISVLSSLLPGRSKKSIFKTCKRYGFGSKREKYKPWSEEELKILKTNGSHKLSTEMTNMLPGRTAEAISAKCFKLNIRKSGRCRLRLALHAQSMQSPDSLLKLDQTFNIDGISNVTRQIILGSVFGDGGCTPRGKRHYFVESHGWDQKDYVLWKQSNLSLFDAKYFESSNPTVFTPSHIIFSDIHAKVYGEEKNKNNLDSSLVSKLDYAGLLIWYLDDGYLGRPVSGEKSNGKPRQTYPHIAAKGYNLKSLYNASKIINEKLQMRSYVLTHKHKGGLNKIICFNKDKNWLFPIWKNIASQLKLSDCMMYKIKYA